MQREVAKTIYALRNPKPNPDGRDRRSAGSAGAEQRRRTDGRHASGMGKAFLQILKVNAEESESIFYSDILSPADESGNGTSAVLTST